MPKIKNISLPNNFSNPFLGPDRDKLWDKLDKNAKPITKEELTQRVKDLKSKKGS